MKVRGIAPTLPADGLATVIGGALGERVSRASDASVWTWLPWGLLVVFGVIGRIEALAREPRRFGPLPLLTARSRCGFHIGIRPAALSRAAARAIQFDPRSIPRSCIGERK